LAAANILERVILGDTLDTAMQFACKTASSEVLALVKQALGFNTSNNQVFTQQVGLVCNLISGFPSIYHNLLHASSYQEAIRQNIYSGGDSCGRAIFLGAVLGASMGVETDAGIPAPWLNQVHCIKDAELLLATCLR
jgi:ADP-ribosylglycohydrolase